MYKCKHCGKKSSFKSAIKCGRCTSGDPNSSGDVGSSVLLPQIIHVSDSVSDSFGGGSGGGFDGGGASADY